MSNVKFTISGFILKYLTLDRKQNKKYVLLSRMYAYNMGRIVASPIKMLKSLILFRDIYLTTEDVDVKFINKMLDMTAMYEFFLAKRSQESLTYIRDMVIHIYKISSDVNQDLIYIIDNWRTFLSSNPPKAIYQNDVSDNIIKYVKRYVVKHLKTLVKPLDEFVSDIIYECPDDLNLLHYCNYICQSLNSEIGSPFFTERIIDRINNGTITLRQFFDDGWDFYVDNINKRDNARTTIYRIISTHQLIKDEKAKEIAIQIEEQCLQTVVKKCFVSDESYVRTWDSPMFINLYSFKISMILNNIDPYGRIEKKYNLKLLDKIISEELKINKLFRCSLVNFLFTSKRHFISNTLC